MVGQIGGIPQAATLADVVTKFHARFLQLLLGPNQLQLSDEFFSIVMILFAVPTGHDAVFNKFSALEFGNRALMCYQFEGDCLKNYTVC
ncbi:MAG: hypothetical protein HGA75_02850 [Thiobacillus sp.]|nr:hypothetical protein [Thiobacillus sp.]